MQCPNCHVQNAQEDAYCSNCGADLAPANKGLMAFQANLPAVFTNTQVQRSVAASVGALAVGVGLELLRRNMLARLTSPRTIERSLPVVGGMKDMLFPQNNKAVKLPKGYEIQETIVSVRRVIRRTH